MAELQRCLAEAQGQVKAAADDMRGSGGREQALTDQLAQKQVGQEKLQEQVRQLARQLEGALGREQTLTQQLQVGPVHTFS